MSRASTLRDEIIADLQAVPALSGETITAWYVPRFTREQLASGRRIVVRSAAREIGSNQGPDDISVTIEVGVVGLVSSRTDLAEADAEAAVVTACDALDGLTETLIGLWAPNGSLASQHTSTHRFVSLSQPVFFDVERLNNDGIWLSVLSLVFMDQNDEPA